MNKKIDKMKVQTLGTDRQIGLIVDKLNEIQDQLDFLDRNQLELFNKERMHRR